MITVTEVTSDVNENVEDFMEAENTTGGSENLMLRIILTIILKVLFNLRNLLVKTTKTISIIMSMTKTISLKKLRMINLLLNNLWILKGLLKIIRS